MYLKQVVLQGFKSFADRTEFDFGPGVTGVVGPNGCGKSNVVDAIKWVLGEQSARSLRGRKMLDVVFNGSRSRQPAEFATVELTFDNRSQFLETDQQDVAVSRTLYRSGDSEYRLNGNLCRLKDIRELFLDTGVAAGAYSIIEQGRVDVLLQASPTERREIFEEAAGISRYRVRRIEAQRKLERTQNNLLRLEDVLDELERRLRSVKLQAGRARSFQEYDARLRELRASFALAEFHELERQRTATEAQLAAQRQEANALRETLRESDATAAGHTEELETLDGELHRLEEQSAACEQELSALEERRQHLEQRIEELGTARVRRQEQATEADTHADTLAARVTEFESTLAELETQFDEQQAAADAFRSQRDEAAARASHARGALESAKNAAFEAVRRATVLHNQEDQLLRQRERLNQERARRAERLAEIEQRHASAAGEADALRATVQQSDAREAELKQALAATDEQRAMIAEQVSAVDRDLAAAKEGRAGVLSRLRVLEDLEARREGLNSATRDVLQRCEQDSALQAQIVGLVADLLRIDDPRADRLQIILSDVEKHLVVRDVATVLELLAAGPEIPGPLRLISLEALRPVADAFPFADVPGVVGRAVDWVHCPDEQRPLAQKLLGKVLLLENAAAARSLQGAGDAGWTLVGLDGYLEWPDGRLVVGADKTPAGLITRRAEIRQLEAQRDRVETELEQLTRRRQGHENDLSDLEVQRQAQLDALVATQRQQGEQHRALTRLEAELHQVERSQAAVQGEVSELASSLAEIESEVATLVSQRDAADAAKDERAQQIERCEQDVLAAEQVVEVLSQQLTDALVAVGRQNERRTAQEAELRNLREQRAGLARQRDAARQEAVQAEQAQADARTALEQAQARRTEVLSRRDALQQELGARRSQRLAIKQQLEQCSARGRELHATIEAQEQALHAAQIALRESEVRTESLLTRTRDELDLDLAAEYAAYEHSDQDWDAVRAEIEDLRRKIQRLGNVNLDALTELEELQPRYDHLVSQRDDLTQSIERLDVLIAELDDESRSRFSATFVDVRTHFQELFRKLFGGGKADIILEDPEQPLECGIEIIARPPGKEPQSISLLSGGEKTLTAVALLLAVFKSRPSPFAILDEVDAALDEANVGRFNTVVQDFLDHSQFVVITHNKRTMQHADVLYGVTMEETGVSKRVSVRFDESADTPNVA
jgi:chromosome segregation protein